MDAVKTYAFASVLDGFWPKRSGNQRARPPQSLVHLLISPVLVRFWACRYTHSRPPVVVALLHRTSAALRCGVSDLVRAAAPLLYASKVITVLPSPQGHAKSLLDAVKTYAFASVLEGFWPKRPGNQRPRPPQSLVHLLISPVLARFWACRYTHSRPPVVVSLLQRTLNNVAA